MKHALSLLLILAACGTEPPPTPVTPATGPPGPPEATGAPAPEGMAPPPDAPPAGEAGKQGPPQLAVQPGEGVLLSGTVTYPGTLTRPIRLDFVQPDPSEERPDGVKVLHAAMLDASGPWSVEVPKNLGQVDIIAFIDVDNNGPSDNEPQATRKGVSIGEAPMTDLNFELVDPPGFVPPDPMEQDFSDRRSIDNPPPLPAAPSPAPAPAATGG